MAADQRQILRVAQWERHCDRLHRAFASAAAVAVCVRVCRRRRRFASALHCIALPCMVDAANVGWPADGSLIVVLDKLDNHRGHNPGVLSRTLVTLMGLRDAIATLAEVDSSRRRS